MNAFGLVARGLAAASLMGMLAACSSTGSKGGLDLGGLTKTSAPPPPVVQGDCPRIVLRDGTAYHDVYLPGAKPLPNGNRDQAKLMYQASIANTTRQCRVTDQGMVITVQVAGRLVLGQAGAKGNVKLPIRVAVTDGSTTLYSELTNFETPLPVNEPSNQFLFTKDDVAIPAGAGISTIYVGFDDGPAAKTKKKK